MADNDLTVHIEPAQRAGVYSNAVSVTINTNEVVVDFGYLVPNTASPEVVVVSRVTMNQATAKNFMDIMQRSFADFEARQNQMAAPQVAPVQQAPVQAPVMPQVAPPVQQAPVMMDPMAMQAPVQQPQVMPQPMMEQPMMDPMAMDPNMSPAPGIPPYPSV